MKFDSRKSSFVAGRELDFECWPGNLIKVIAPPPELSLPLHLWQGCLGGRHITVILLAIYVAITFCNGRVPGGRVL